MARKETCEPLGLAVAFDPASGRGKRHDRTGPATLGELEREGATKRIAHKMRATHPELVEMTLEMVGARRECQRAVDVKRRSTVVTGECRRDHLIASGELA